MRSFRDGSGRLLRAAGFLAILLLLNVILSWLLRAYSIVDVDFHKIAQGDVQDLIVGSSHGLSGLDPDVLEEYTGSKTQNACLGGEFPIDSFYIIQEAERHQKLKRVIYELDPGYWVAGNHYNAVYQSFPRSALKVRYYLDRVLMSDFRMTLLPWYQYAHDYRSIPRIVQAKQSASYRRRDAEILRDTTYFCKDNGFMYINRIEGAAKDSSVPVLWEQDNVKEDSLRYFQKMRKYCQENGIELVVVTLPIPTETLKQYEEHFRGAYEYFKELLQDSGVVYYNLNYGAEKMRLSAPDFNDYDGHMYGDTAARVSKKLGELVAKE